MAIMFVAIPFIVRILGEVSFSILSLTWTVIGYFALWDLGIGRAVTKFVAERSAAGRDDEVSMVIYQSIALSFALGALFGALLLVFEKDIAVWLFSVPPVYRSEVKMSLRIVAFSMPVLVLQGSLRGALMGFSRFDLTNFLQVGNGILQWGGALCLVLLKYNVVTVIGFVLLSRILTTILSFAFLWKIVDLSSAVRIAERKMLRSMVSFGGWAMVSQIVSPVLQYTERFMLSGIIATSVVAYYVIPYEATSKLLVLSVGLASVLFPAFSEMQGKAGGRNDLGFLYRRSERMMLFSFLPMGVILVGFAPELLRLWIGAQFASRSLVAFQILAVAFVVNSISQMPFTHLQAIGRTDITGKIHLAELPFHLAMAYILISLFGLVGAAAATLTRIAVDASLLYYFSSRRIVRVVPLGRSGMRDVVLIVFIAIAGTGLIMAATYSEPLKLAISALWMFIYMFIVFKFLLDREEKESVFRLMSWKMKI